MSKKILVTGADGFIGSHLTEELVRQGFEVRAFTLYNSFNSWGWLDYCGDDVKGNFEVFCGDIRDPNGVRVAMKGCYSVIHLASLIAIPYSYHSPDSYIDTNIKGTLNVLQASRDLNLSQIIHTSTSEVYGTARFVPITEDHPLQGQSPYSASKIAADQLAFSFFTSFDLPVTILRPFNTYGPRQSARAVIPTVITQLLAGKKQIHLGALEPTRDFSYVSDTVSGFIQALNKDGIAGRTINLGSNFEISINETVQLIAEILGLDVEITSDNNRMRPKYSEVQRLWSDNSLAKKIIDYNPEYAGRDGLKKGLIQTIDWFRNQDNLKFYKSDIYNV